MHVLGPIDEGAAEDTAVNAADDTAELPVEPSGRRREYQTLEYVHGDLAAQVVAPAQPCPPPADNVRSKEFSDWKDVHSSYSCAWLYTLLT